MPPASPFYHLTLSAKIACWGGNRGAIPVPFVSSEDDTPLRADGRLVFARHERGWGEVPGLGVSPGNLWVFDLGLGFLLAQKLANTLHPSMRVWCVAALDIDQSRAQLLRNLARPAGAYGETT